MSQVTDKLYHIMFYTSPWSRFELTTMTSVVIGTDCKYSCKSNYHTITATTVPYFFLSNIDCYLDHINEILGLLEAIVIFMMQWKSSSSCYSKENNFYNTFMFYYFNVYALSLIWKHLLWLRFFGMFCHKVRRCRNL
jgi:hypothetical protein